jgi:hypothetical protein
MMDFMLNLYLNNNTNNINADGLLVKYIIEGK